MIKQKNLIKRIMYYENKLAYNKKPVSYFKKQPTGFFAVYTHTHCEVLFQQRLQCLFCFGI